MYIYHQLYSSVMIKTIVLQISPSFKRNFSILLKKRGQKHPFERVPTPYQIYSWMAPQSEHSVDYIRAEDGEYPGFVNMLEDFTDGLLPSVVYFNHMFFISLQLSPHDWGMRNTSQGKRGTGMKRFRQHENCQRKPCQKG